MLRRIEHAARNTAAAPFWRRSSLEWPSKIRFLVLRIGRLCCIFGVCWGLSVTILGALGVHFGSQNRSFSVPGGALGTLTKLSPKKEAKKEKKDQRCHSILEAILAPFSNDFWIDFLIRFLDHFWSHFGPILGAKMEPKSMKKSIQNSIKLSVGF